MAWGASFANAVRAFEAEGRTAASTDITALVQQIRNLPPGMSVLDTPLRDAPFGVIESNTGDPILLSDFYGALVGEDKFTESSDSPVLYRGRGELANVRALGHFAQPASPACLRPDRPTGKIPLPAPLFPNFHLVTAVGIADADASVRLTLDGRPGGSLAWRDGKDTTTSWVEGGGAIVHLELTAGDSACITSVEVGPAQVLQVLPR